LLALAAPAAAQSPTSRASAPDSLVSTVNETVDTARKIQTSLDDWSQERTNLERRYRAAQANVTYLQELTARENEKAAALDGAVAELERRLIESTRMQAVIQDTLNAVLGRLETVVATDLPFLAAEREARIANLRRNMAQPDQAPAEKLRFLLEAMLIEAQYGETVEVEPQTIIVAGQETHADVLRIGRLAMFWRSPDGKRVGTWDPETRAWVDLPGKHNRVIARAIEMAEHTRPIDLVSLPLGRISR
jgi:seryl-tRNA synthetase